MKHRDIFRAPARVERRSKIVKTWKDGNETRTDTEDLGYFIIVTLGTVEFAFYHGEHLALSSPTVDIIIEYTVPDV